MLPTCLLGAPINRALLPGFSQIAQNPAQLHSAYANAMGILVLFSLPAAAGIFAVSDYLFPVALGPKWLAAVPLMHILAFSGAILLFYSSMCTSLCAAAQRAAVVR